MELLVKLTREAGTFVQCKKDRLEQAALFHQHKNFKSVPAVNNVDVV